MALNGKIAVVTGAVMGIGKAVTELLLQNGAKVNICQLLLGNFRLLKKKF